RHDGIGRFREEEWRLLRRVSAHFLRVLGVVAPDAIDVTDRKALIAADGRNGRQIPGGHGVLHASHSSSSCRALADERTEPPVSHSASGWRAGAASANAGSALHADSMRTSVGYGDRSMSKRRAFASCGTTQMSASVGASP